VGLAPARRDDTADPHHVSPTRQIELGIVALAGVALSAIAAALTAANVSGEGAALAVLVRASTVAVPIAVGIYAWLRRPDERFGRLLVVLGGGWFLTTLAQSSDPLAFSAGRVAAWVMEVAVVFLVLAFPTGRLGTRLDRQLVAAAVALVGLLYLPTALMVEHYPEPTPWSSCEPGCPANALMLLDAQPAFVDQIVLPLRAVLTVLLFLAVTLRLIQRVRNASELMRRTLLPVLAVAIARLVVYVVGIVARAPSPDSAAVDALTWALTLGVPALAVAFFVGLLERRLYVAKALQQLGLRTRADSSAGELRTALAEAVDDPTLEIVYPAEGTEGGWRDAGGAPRERPADDDPDRRLTEIRDGDRIVAGLLHDAALCDHGEFVEAVAAYALIALENRRLTGAVEASLSEVRDSRARIVATADRERRRIERDLHDGAQQRLVALGIQLELAGELVATDSAAGQERLRALQGEVTETLEEIRGLAHGVYPPLLADRGLPDALRSAARGAPVPTAVEPDGIVRYPQEVESAVYFCCLEALQNVSKHATGASAVAIILEHGAALRFEVRDDGPGFVVGGVEGDGLTNMRDRLAAVGGELEIRSAPGSGTVVAGTIPLPGCRPPRETRANPLAESDPAG
jgi:signal transduction histidine kinase